ncbi:hypothetical protein [Salinimicrobium oceani]|uniref:Lipoprotein n=1 Tax=Salinimicrobium oceani TaxID=2722702 RepID=A0ABX1CYU8_9FLAO|nr:hypothetical protein [Salinimicrobium oceani]NJW52018.1 hypothetical protein [Salinimicrobium oceani]
MKPFLLLFSAFVILLSFSNCANGKQLQEKAPKAVKQPYYTSWTGGVKAAGSGFNLFIPVEETASIIMDTVYFRGKKGILERDPSNEHLYVARFKIGATEHDRDFVMHEDPKKEYGNQIPVVKEKIPFELAEGEAVVRYTENGKAKYFRLTGIQKREAAEVKVKNPENIQH